MQWTTYSIRENPLLCNNKWNHSVTCIIIYTYTWKKCELCLKSVSYVCVNSMVVLSDPCGWVTEPSGQTQDGVGGGKTR